MRMRVGLSQQIGLSVDEANEFGHDALHRHLATVEFTPANFKIVFKKKDALSDVLARGYERVISLFVF